MSSSETRGRGDRIEKNRIRSYSEPRKPSLTEVLYKQASGSYSNLEKATLGFEPKEHDQKEEQFQLARLLFHECKDKLDLLPLRLEDLRTIFEASNTEARQLQNITDSLRIPGTHELIENIIDCRVMGGLTARGVVSLYLKSEGFDPSDFGSVLDIITNVDKNLSKNDMEAQLRQNLPGETIIATQNHVFRYMSGTNQLLREELQDIQSESGFEKLNRFFTLTDPLYSITDYDHIDVNMTKTFEISIDDDYKKISNDNKENFRSIKEENWEKFQANYKTVINKIHNTSLCLFHISQTFS